MALERSFDHGPAGVSGAGHDRRRRGPSTAAGVDARSPDAPRPPPSARPPRPPGALRADRRRGPAALRQDPSEPGPLLGQLSRRAGADLGGILQPLVSLAA